jgi:hypothetical protein
MELNQVEQSDDEEYKVSLWQRDQSIGVGNFRCEYTIEDHCSLTLEFNGYSYSATALDFFEALCSIRKELEQLDIIPDCYGAAINCFPSSMGRSMSDAMVVHYLEIGKRGGPLKHLFETSSDLALSTVAEQEAFYEQWLKSLNLANHVSIADSEKHYRPLKHLIIVLVAIVLISLLLTCSIS